jgi:hypothetical protein
MECLGTAAIVATISSAGMTAFNTIRSLFGSKKEPRKVVNIRKRVRKHSVSTYNNSNNKNSTKIESVNFFRSSHNKHSKYHKKEHKSNSCDDIQGLRERLIEIDNNVNWKHLSVEV